MAFKDKIKELRLSRNLTQSDVAKGTNMSPSSIGMYEQGRRLPSFEVLESFADFFNVSLDVLADSKPVECLKPERQGVKIPILGTVVAGVPITAIEDILGYEEITRDMAKHGDFFALQIQGHSMEPNLWDGDIVIVRSQPTVENNEIAIILVNGDEATVKLVKKSPEGITLIGFNTKVYPPHFYTVHEIETLPVTIVGKVIEGRRRFK